MCLIFRQFCCNGEQDRFLVFVHSKPWQGDLRNDVRNTWGNRRLKELAAGASKVLFVVGRNENYRETERKRERRLEIPHPPTHSASILLSSMEPNLPCNDILYSLFTQPGMKITLPSCNG